jgi:O-acetyl-ADP-ribose deacetylase
VWSGGGESEDELLASCYRTALDLAAQHRLASIAFPAISTGIYRFPPDRAAQIAVGTVTAELASSRPSLANMVFCCFTRRQQNTTSRLLPTSAWPNAQTAVERFATLLCSIGATNS